MKIYMVGIKGMGMASLAVLYKKQGHDVTGSDIAEEFPTDRVLRDAGIPSCVGFEGSNVPDGVELVVTTGAHGGLENVEVQEARGRGVRILTHAQAVGELMGDFTSAISVSGTHGKTTTSAMAAFVLRGSAYKGAHLVGAPLFSGLDGGELRGSDYIVIEADEYMADAVSDKTPRFMYQHPDYLLATNIEYDHVDVYASLDEVKQAFLRFFTTLRSKPQSRLIYCSDEETLTSVAQEAVPRGQRISYGLNLPTDLLGHSIEVHETYTSFHVSYQGKELGEFTLGVIGVKNVLNALGVIILATEMGMTPDQIRTALKDFRGVVRRFQMIHAIGSSLLIDDYAHHPTELAVLIGMARSAYPNRRILLVFQPHMQSRTSALKHEFVDALTLADRAYVLDIYASAREKKESSKITSEDVVDLALARDVKTISYLKDDDIPATLMSDVRSGDIILTAGAGDIYKYHEGIKKVMKED